MIFAISRFDAPRARSERISKSIDTEGSPDSIFAILDWLDFTIFANCIWVSFRFCRLFLRLSPSLSLSSMYADSSGVSWRNSSTVPTLQPFSSRRFFFVLCIVIILNTLFADVNHAFRSLRGFFLKYFQNKYCIIVDTIYDAPCSTLVINSKLVAPLTYRWHLS